MNLERIDTRNEVEFSSSRTYVLLPPLVGSFELDLSNAVDLVKRRLNAEVMKRNSPYFFPEQQPEGIAAYFPKPTSTMGYYIGSLDKAEEVFEEESQRGQVLIKSLTARFGEYGPTMAESRLRTGLISQVLSPQRDFDLALYEWLDTSAKIELIRLNSQMSEDAEKIRQQTSDLVGNPLKRYSVIEKNGKRGVVISAPLDSRDFGIQKTSLSKLYFGSSFSVQRGYRMRDLLFNGSLKGPHAITYINEFLR